jgi:hypothetical protein
VFLPAPFGGTALFDDLRAQGRLLDTLPFACYYDPYLAFVPKHYRPAELYAHRIGLLEAITAPGLWWRRLRTKAHPLAKLVHAAQLLAVRAEIPVAREILRQLNTDREFREFHEGRTDRLPDFYRAEIQRRLGRYATLLTEADLRPCFPALVQSAPALGDFLSPSKDQVEGRGGRLIPSPQPNQVTTGVPSQAANDGAQVDPTRRVA